MLSGFELYPRWVPLWYIPAGLKYKACIYHRGTESQYPIGVCYAEIFCQKLKRRSN